MNLRLWIAHIVIVEHDFWARARPRTVQFIMGTASFLWAYAVAAESHTGWLMVPYEMMRALLPAMAWVGLFVLHGLLVLVCRWAPTYRWRTHLGTNVFGFVLWAFYVASAWFSLGHFAIGTSLEVVMIFMSGWLIYRTLRKPSDPEEAASRQDAFTAQERAYGGGDALMVAGDGR